jgi:excisionase family DNA binding protein
MNETQQRPNETGAVPTGDHAILPVDGKSRRETLTVEEARTVLGLGRNGAYRAIRRGEIPAIRVGRRLLIPRAALDRLLAGTNSAHGGGP